MEEGALSSYVSQARSALTEAPEMSARTAELRLTQPLLDALGWDLHGSDVTAGVEIDGDRLDFGLAVEGDLAVLVDTVAPEAGIEETDVRTLATGMRRRSVERGVLVDGRTYLFLTDAGKRFDHDRYELSDLPEARDALRPFTRAATAERAAPDPTAFRQAAVALDGDREDLIEEVATRLTAATDAGADAVAATVREETATFVDDLVATLAERGETDGSSSAGGGDGPSEAGGSWTDETAESTAATDDAAVDGATDDANDAVDETTDDADDAVAAADGPEADTTDDDGGSLPAQSEAADDASVDPAESAPSVRDRTPDEAGAEGDPEEYVVRFFDGSTTVGAVGGDTPHTALRQGVEYLEDGHALVSRLSVPWRPEEAPGIAVVNDSPEHPDGTPWHDYVELSTGDYLLTGVEPEGCREILEGLAGGAGLRVMFQGDW